MLFDWADVQGIFVLSNPAKQRTTTSLTYRNLYKAYLPHSKTSL